MKNLEILKRIQALSGDISEIKDETLIDILKKITFKEALYFKNYDEPFGDFYDDFYEANKELPRNEFIDKAIRRYYIDSEGEAFWCGELFTPFTPNTHDYDEWSGYFDKVDRSKFLAVTGGKIPEFLILVRSHSFPDHFFICVNDINSDNPTVFSTDHEVYFDEVEIEGNLSEFFNGFITKEECRTAVGEFLDEISAVD